MAEYRRFIAPTLEEAKREMIKEMGTKAYIVKNNRIVKKRLWGLKKDYFVEIQAGKLNGRALDFKNKPKPRSLKKPDANLSFLEEIANPSTTSPPPAKGSNRQQSLEKVQKLITEKYLSQKEPSAHGKPSPRLRSGTGGGPAAYKKSSLTYVPSDLPLMEAEVGSASPASSRYSGEKGGGIAAEDKLGNKELTSFLKEWEFDDNFIEMICRDYSGPRPNSVEGKTQLADFIAGCFKYSGKIKHYASSPNIALFVGVTGIGKTTTLAKIASQYSVMDGKKCVLATFDVIRIMATAQLGKYADIMRIPFRVLMDKSDLKKLIKDFINYELIFIDTAGTSHHDSSYIGEMEAFVNYIESPKEVHFCLNASLRKREMVTILDHFESIPFDRVIITKVDESATLGPILSVLYKRKLDISYLTNGQDVGGVPGDFFLGTRESVREQLLKEWK